MHEWKTFEGKDALTNETITWVFNEYDFSPIAKLKNDKNYTILSDHLGTPKIMYDEKGEEVWSGALDIYGRTKKETGTQGFCPFRYQGQYFDEEINLCYNRFRYFEPESGNYISQDPIGLLGNNPTFYGYVADSNTWVDPFGLSPIPSFDVLKDMAQNTLDFSTTKDGAVFWSGSNMKNAQDWALKNGKTTLEQTKGGKYLDSLDLFNPKNGLTGNQAAEVWNIASKRFADGASGNINVFSTGAKRFGPFGERTWWRIEKPALLKNINVKNIFRRNKAGGKTKTGHIKCK